MTNTQLTEQELDHHLRRTLQAVAATVEGEQTAAPKRRRTARRVVIGAGALAVAAPLAAGAFFGAGSEYVDEIPPNNVLVTGSVEGHRYWMVDAFHKDDCGKTVPGVELVVEDRNILGQEWDTHLMTYGDDPTRGCRYDPSQWLADPSRWDMSGAKIDDTFVWVVSVHPDITAVRVTTDGTPKDLTVHAVDGAGYSIFELPPDTTTYTVEVVVDGSAVTGSAETRSYPDFIPE